MGLAKEAESGSQIVYLLATITVRGERGDVRKIVAERSVLTDCQTDFATRSQHLRMPVDSVCSCMESDDTHFLAGGPANISSTSSALSQATLN